MSNPYQAPMNSGVPASTFGLAAHVPVIGILLIIQGALEILMGLVLAGMGIFMTVLPSITPPNAAQEQPPPAFFTAFGVVYAVIGVGVVAIAILKIWAGWKNRLYRSRAWGIAAVCSSFATMMTCYCAPTGLALAIYGLVVYLNDRTTQAFVLGEQGYTPQQIRDALS